jgi:hypothetical protein
MNNELGQIQKKETMIKHGAKYDASGGNQL